MASALYTEMARFARRPQPFAISTIADLWTDLDGALRAAFA